MIKVSVIIPTYNRERCIARALDSVTSQTYHNLEILVCDDASTDDTCNVVNSYKEKDDRIRLLELPYNQGSAAARNLGLSESKGEYIAFLDSDDEWLPPKIEKQVRKLENLTEEWGICYTGSKITKNGKYEVEFVPNQKVSGDVFKDFIKRVLRPFMTPTVMIRKACIEKVGGFDERLIRSQDIDLFMRILMHYKLAVVSEILTIVHMDTTKAFGKNVEKSRLLILGKHESYIRENYGASLARFFKADMYWIIADAELINGARFRAVKYLFKAIFTYPFISIKRYLRTFLSLLGVLKISMSIYNNIINAYRKAIGQYHIKLL